MKYPPARSSHRVWLVQLEVRSQGMVLAEENVSYDLINPLLDQYLVPYPHDTITSRNAIASKHWFVRTRRVHSELEHDLIRNSHVTFARLGVDVWQL